MSIQGLDIFVCWVPWPCLDVGLWLFFPFSSQKEFSLSTEKIAAKDDENSERGNWSSKTDYLLSMVGYAVGLGNVWRFPYLTYQNGGGAFLIPYTIMLALAGLPLFFLECSLGQFASLGPVSIWRILPLLQGVGVTMVVISTFVTIYYNVIIGYSLYYLFASFQSVLPWADCDPDWADDTCSKYPIVSDCNATWENGTVIHANYSWIVSHNLTCLNDTKSFAKTQVPSEQYWNKKVLQRSPGLDETGEVVWYLALCLLLSWLIVGVALFKGIKSSGKVVYFTAIFPYVVLIILLVRGVTLEGAREGIEYYIGNQSNFTKLMEAEVWKDAATQIFFSLSVAWGGLVALSSYNKFHNNCYSDAIFVCVINCLTSVFAGFAIFSILGHMAFMADKKVSEVVDSGFDLAFVAYPEALSKLPVAPLWSFLFFFMLLLLGLDSQFATIETITTTIQDSFPKVMKKMRVPVTLGLCMLLFLLGLVCVTQAGIYWVNLVDHFCAGWGILFAAVLELAGICWIYGGNRFIEDIEMMIGKKSFLFWLWWRICWFAVTPCLLLAILVWSLVTFAPPKYGSVEYPEWGSAVGWCMIMFCLIWIPVIAIYKIAKAQGNLWQRIVNCCKPQPNWGPYLECHRGERYRNMVELAKERDLEIPTVDSYVPKFD
ncbi:sodium- and chloride-dependent neutral and basic amino acid transporter B(0+) isoform X2 [Anolis carolinensis]|uniref:sodium- and chloride-dependent neutral and basic amino acid transporter B(0+) isoform X2 n=1 Tax=Anolis carolinensis TaxID=28377 RepID=UPI002F2B34A6